MSILENISSIRNLIKKNNIDALLIYGTDPHLSEYVPQDWRSVEWVSGFTGSYGKVVITKDKAALWTDSRYFIQAETQLKGSGFILMKERQTGTIPIEKWLIEEFESGSRVAINGLTLSAANASVLRENLSAKGIVLITNIDLISPIWLNRPVLNQSKVTDYPVKFSGQSRSEKLSIIRRKLKEVNSNALLICQLDDLAWSFNLRGNEVSYNPVFAGYGYIDNEQAILFIHDGKLTNGLVEKLNSEGIQVKNYDLLFSVLEQNIPKVVYLDPDRTNSVIQSFLTDKCTVIEGLAIPTLLQSIKNKVEIAGTRSAHRRDGVAMVNFLYWFHKHSQRERMTELSISEELIQFRSEQRYFVGESFCSIVAFGPHGAIVHYNPTPESDVEISRDGVLLIDSGGQYLDGTTDITRTIAIGKVNSTMQFDFTVVLKGMINLAKAKFPEGTKGYSLDSIARNELWNNSLNYGHGTGHGVGHYLSVHEGPMSIRTEYNSQPIKPGQILTVEPGLYREGKYGIRIENVLLCKKAGVSVFGTFLSFETLTLCPIDKRLIKRSLLNAEEKKWLNKYHKKVLNTLNPYLKSKVRIWLTAQCAPL